MRKFFVRRGDKRSTLIREHCLHSGLRLKVEITIIPYLPTEACYELAWKGNRRHPEFLISKEREGQGEHVLEARGSNTKLVSPYAHGSGVVGKRRIMKPNPNRRGFPKGNPWKPTITYIHNMTKD